MSKTNTLAAAALSLVLAACSGGAPPPGDASGPPAPADATAVAGDAPPPVSGAPVPPASPDPLPAAFEGATIPARFHGVYSRDGECGDTRTDSRLVIQADTVAFHESRGRVLRAHGDGDSLNLVLSLAGEGQTRDAAYAFRREAGGEQLVDTENRMTRVRCAEKAAG